MTGVTSQAPQKVVKRNSWKDES